MFEWLIGLFDGQIVDWVIGAIITFLGWRWLVLKNLLKELKELFTVITDALSDDKLTDEEREAVLKEVKDVAKLIQELFRNEKPVTTKLKSLMAKN